VVSPVGFEQAKYNAAVSDFQYARRQADLETIIARLTGHSAELLSYEQVRRQLKAQTPVERGLQNIPLDAIVGSVGRYGDFTRTFLPLQDSSRERWARVKAAMTSQVGLPSIEVYQIGQVYFVLDGNHRVSVARQLGATHIEARVTEVLVKVPLSPDTQPDDLIIKAEYAAFLEKTQLDQLRPEAYLRVTAPGQYELLLEHIEVHRYFMGLEQQREIPYREAVAHWYDEVFLPVVAIIRQRGMLRDFPDRTETDLYLWLAEHRTALAEALGWEIRPEAAAADLVRRRSSRPGRVISRVGGRLLHAVTPTLLEGGPPPGTWRQESVAVRPSDRLFPDILVPLDGSEEAWTALEQAVLLAQREGARLHGLHVVLEKFQLESERARAVQVRFDRRCEQSEVPGKLVVKHGEVAQQICQAARWVDLVVVRLAHPPSPGPLARLSSGFRILIRGCPRPVLAVPGQAFSPDRIVLAYDASPKAQEALYVAAYAAGCWKSGLVIVTVEQKGLVTSEVQDHAREYLESRGVEAQWVSEPGAVPEIVLQVAQDYALDLLMMGGYGHRPLVEAVLGSAVDQVLRESARPVLVCR
jgi:nucleotide-binding universal stress UspA family protein